MYGVLREKPQPTRQLFRVPSGSGDLSWERLAGGNAPWAGACLARTAVVRCGMTSRHWPQQASMLLSLVTLLINILVSHSASCSIYYFCHILTTAHAACPSRSFRPSGVTRKTCANTLSPCHIIGAYDFRGIKTFGVVSAFVGYGLLSLHV